MKVSFGEKLNRQDSSGKHKFLHRLSKEFKEQGIDVVDKQADVFLHIGRNLDQRKGAKRSVMRVDGLILNSDMPYHKMNKKMLRGIGESDGVIYQSQFCKKAHEKFLGVKKKNAVIFNGADPKEFSPRNPQNFFLAVAKWRPHKRLKNICDAFLHARNLGLDADLVIVGEHGKRIKEKHVSDLGELNNKQLQRYLSEAIAMIHISWLDWCANSQIESIVAHCPLVYSDSGGSAEVGKNCGIAIKDVQWDFKTPVRLYKPPELSLDDIAHAMITLKHSSYVTESKSFHVKSIARQYIDFFKSLG